MIQQVILSLLKSMLITQISKLEFASDCSDLTTGIQQLLLQVTNSIIPHKYQENFILLLFCCVSTALSCAKKHFSGFF